MWLVDWPQGPVMVMACGQEAWPVWLVDWPQGPVMVMACGQGAWPVWLVDLAMVASDGPGLWSGSMASVTGGRGHGGQ